MVEGLLGAGRCLPSPAPGQQREMSATEVPVTS